mmetsp:Transcript_19682/g.63977  ORF Transcript_19682/g.63977 Transcript_19682/m.63977 type:complete len:240 (+) Transcript_19682:1084-1803(+)
MCLSSPEHVRRALCERDVAAVQVHHPFAQSHLPLVSRLVDLLALRQHEVARLELLFVVVGAHQNLLVVRSLPFALARAPVVVRVPARPRSAGAALCAAALSLVVSLLALLPNRRLRGLVSCGLVGCGLVSHHRGGPAEARHVERRVARGSRLRRGSCSRRWGCAGRKGGNGGREADGTRRREQRPRVVELLPPRRLELLQHALIEALLLEHRPEIVHAVRDHCSVQLPCPRHPEAQGVA